MAGVPARRLGSPSPAVQRTLRGFQGAIFARLDGLGGGTDEREVPFQSRAVVGPEFENGHPAPGEILLIAEVLVGKDEEGKPGCFSGCKQLAILNPLPSLRLDGADVVTDEGMAHLHGNALVEQDCRKLQWKKVAGLLRFSRGSLMLNVLLTATQDRHRQFAGDGRE